MKTHRRFPRGSPTGAAPAEPTVSFRFVTAAIFGLIGVVVGGLITAFIEGFYRWRDTKRRRRQAARLLREELEWIGTAINLVKKHANLSGWDDPSQLLALWQIERAALVDLPWEDWRVIALAMRMLSSVHSLFTHPVATSTATPEQIVETATELREQIDGALGALEKHAT
jgi:hypothetical protein